MHKNCFSWRKQGERGSKSRTSYLLVLHVHRGIYQVEQSSERRFRNCIIDDKNGLSRTNNCRVHIYRSPKLRLQLWYDGGKLWNSKTNNVGTNAIGDQTKLIPVRDRTSRSITKRLGRHAYFMGRSTFAGEFNITQKTGTNINCPYRVIIIRITGLADNSGYQHIETKNLSIANRRKLNKSIF